MWNYTDEKGNNLLIVNGAFDRPDDPPLVFINPNQTVLAINLPLNGTSIPWDARPIQNPATAVTVNPGAPLGGSGSDTTTTTTITTSSAQPDPSTTSSSGQTETSTTTAPSA